MIEAAQFDAHASRSRPGRRYRPTAWQWRRIALQQRLKYALRVQRMPTLRILSGRSIHLEGNVPSFPLHCGKRFGRPAAYIEVTSWQAIPPDRMAMAAHCPPATPAMRVACPTAVHAENSERSQHPPERETCHRFHFIAASALGDRRHTSRSRPDRRCPTAWQWRRIALQQRLQCALRVLEGGCFHFPALW